jgi:hypothetical protein
MQVKQGRGAGVVGHAVNDFWMIRSVIHGISLTFTKEEQEEDT